MDPVAAAMARASITAARSRRGNALYVLGAVESPPAALAGSVSAVTVNLPWGSLLRAVAAPDTALLRNIAEMSRPGAVLAVTYSASPRDAAEVARLGISEPDPTARGPEMSEAYEASGWQLASIECLPANALARLGTTWSKRLSRDPQRRAWRIIARRD